MIKSGQTFALLQTVCGSDGVNTNADSLPTADLYVNGVSNAASVIVTNVGTGLYKLALTMPGLSAGDCVQLLFSATVGGTAVSSVIFTDTSDTKLVSGLVDAPALIQRSEPPSAADIKEGISGASVVASNMVSPAPAMITQQEVADALKLGLSPGDPDEDSIAQYLVDLLSGGSTPPPTVEEIQAGLAKEDTVLALPVPPTIEELTPVIEDAVANAMASLSADEIVSALVEHPEFAWLFAVTGGNSLRSADGDTVTFYLRQDTERTTPVGTFHYIKQGVNYLRDSR